MIQVPTKQTLDVSELERKSMEELVAIAQQMGLENGSALTSLRKEDVVIRIVHTFPDQQRLRGSGILEVMNDGYGFLRHDGLKPGPGDIYVSQSQTRRFASAAVTPSAARSAPPRAVSDTSALCVWTSSTTLCPSKPGPAQPLKT